MENKKNKIALLIPIFTLFLLCSTFFLNTQEVNAAVGVGDDLMDFYVPYSRPEGEGVGYVSIVVEIDGEHYLHTYIVNRSEYDSLNDHDYGNNGTVTFSVEDDIIEFEVINGSEKSLVVYSFYRIYGVNDNFQHLSSGLLSYRGSEDSVYAYSLNWANYGYDIVGFEVGGDVIMYDYSLGSFKAPRIHWGSAESEASETILLYNSIIDLISKNQTLLETYLPHLNKIDFAVTTMRSTLNEILTIIQDDSALLKEYIPYLFPILNNLRSLDAHTDEIEGLIKELIAIAEADSELLHEYIPNLLLMLNNLRVIDSSTDELEHLLKLVLYQGTDNLHDFESNSQSQTESLNSLNQQTSVDKPNVDNMSNKVDENLDVDIDANYGMLLSSITSNSNILSMMLVVVSVSLIAYVLFGKR